MFKAVKYLPVCGTVIHGTMRAQDLVPAFMDFYCEHVSRTAAEHIRRDWHEVKKLWWKDHPEHDVTLSCVADEDNEAFWSSGTVQAFLNEDLMDLLQDACPPYTYFGTTEGDGSDYGVWIDNCAVENDICIQRATAVPNRAQTLALLKDHPHLRWLMVEDLKDSETSLYKLHMGKTKAYRTWRKVW